MRSRLERQMAYKWIFAVVVTGMLSACTPTHFGARLCTVTLDSEKSGEAAYLIPNEHYLEMKPALDKINVNTDTAELERYYQKYYRGKTPFVVRILPYQWVYVVKDTNGHFSPPLTFNPNNYMDSNVKPYRPTASH